MEQKEEVSRGNRTYNSEFPLEGVTYEEMMNNYLKRKGRYGKHNSD